MDQGNTDQSPPVQDVPVQAPATDTTQMPAVPQQPQGIVDMPTSQQLSQAAPPEEPAQPSSQPV